MIVQDEPLNINLRELQPLRDWLVVEHITSQQQLNHPYRAGVIEIPEIAQNKPHYGKVLRVGPGRRFPDGTRKPMEVRVGDIVSYQSAEIDAQNLVLIQEADVLFIECPNG